MILNDNSPEFPTVPPFGSPNPQAGESVCDLNLHVLTRRDWLVVEEEAVGVAEDALGAASGRRDSLAV